MSVGPGATDCGAASQVCTQQGCAVSATDTLASSNQLEATNYYNLMGNVLTVESGRKLTNIEMYLTLSASRALTWAVYQQNVVNGYTEFDLKYEKMTTGSAGTGFQSSGTISTELAAGKTYAIGVAVTDGSFVDYFDTVPAPPSLDFAHAIGSTAAPFATTFASYMNLNRLYYSRLTTTAP